MEQKIFFTDLDGTLLNDDKKITPATMECLNRITDQGHILVLISGRPPLSVIEMKETLHIPDQNLYYVAFNGGLTIEAKTGKIIDEHRLTMEQVRYLVNTCQNRGVHIHSYNKDHIIAKAQTPELTFYQRNIHLPALFTDDIPGALTEPPCKCLIISLEGQSVLREIRDELLPMCQDQVQLVFSNEWLLEAFPATSGKGAAMAALARHLNIPLSHTLAAGDQDNDISMLQTAGIGIAMCNGSDGAKKAAGKVTACDNNHDGLVPFLEKFFLT